MGFGILFIGYIFLLNLSFYAYTDILAGVLMLLALDKLKVWNKGFKLSYLAMFLFFLVGGFEFALKILSMFSLAISPSLFAVASSIRMFSLCPMHICLLIGMKQICMEVGLQKMENRA